MSVLESGTRINAEARRAVGLVWNSDSSAKDVVDPREVSFATAVIKEFSRELVNTPALIQQIMASAASAAEDLNVEPHQGLIEVLQNADDLGAKEVRFALRETQEDRQLLIVHDGEPVTFAHVLPMTLPFLTTKGDDANQKGRFGIGLKTLARIASRLSVHSHPYHFQAEKLVLSLCKPEKRIENFYDPTKDTLLVLDLKTTFDEDGLQAWFDSWEDDGLLFLSSVHTFRWCDLDGTTRDTKSVSAQEWLKTPYSDVDNGVIEIRERTIRTRASTWRLFTGQVAVPEHLERAHKAKGDFTLVSFAVPDSEVETGFFIAFKTRVPISLPFSIDAQFDPSTAREELIDNEWNRWLLDRCSNVVAAVAIGTLATTPLEAWRAIPLSTETIGASEHRWPGKQFRGAFEKVRHAIGDAELLMNGELVPLSDTAYECADISDLLNRKDVEVLSDGKKAVTTDVRDSKGRWRAVLNDINVSQTIGFEELLKGMASGYFTIKPPNWWVEAGAKITDIHPAEKIYGAPFLLATDGRAVACALESATSRPLVFGDGVSDFARRWRLLDQIHDAYGRSSPGKRVRDWLTKNAAFTIRPNPAVELAAFAELYSEPVEISDEQLREIRDQFDLLPDRAASEIGASFGRAILLNGHTYKEHRREPRKVSPRDAYLPKTLDSEHPDWPEAAGDLPGLIWLSASYDEALKSQTGRRSRRRADGGLSRGARRFLMLLGAECAPRLVTEDDQQYPERESQRLEVHRKGAETVGHNIKSPDLERVVIALQHMSKRDRKIRGAVLIRVLSRHWSRVYSGKLQVPAYHTARRKNHRKGHVSADWLCLLKQSAWVVVGNGDLSEPSKAVIRSPQTETLYENKAFIAGVDESEIENDFAAAIGLITAVRASDVMERLKAIKQGEKPGDIAHIMQVYRTLSKLCPPASNPSGSMGDVPPHQAQREFGMGTGLICLEPGEWRKPSDLFSGRDIFHDPNLFVPGGAAYADLWRMLQIRPPKLGDCTRYCCKLAQMPYSSTSEATLMDIYRYLEELLSDSDRKNKDRLRNLPLACSGRWVDTRPVFVVVNSEVRGQLERVLPGVNFWSPPCELSGLLNFTSALDVQIVEPKIEVVAQNKIAEDEGSNWRERFQKAVEALTSELARSEPTTREKISITWDALRDIPLFVYPAPFEATASHSGLNGGKTMRISLRAYLAPEVRELHVSEDAIGRPKTGGRAIASLFPWEVRPHIEAQWAASWLESQQETVETMRFAADAEQKEKSLAATRELADTLNPLGGKIEVSIPASRASSATPQRLKTFQGGVTAVTVHVGSPAPTNGGVSIPLVSSPPPASNPGQSGSKNIAPVQFTNADLEQRGWELLSHALSRADAPALLDFRKRHGVGADGAIDWKKFVELKASARSLPTSIEMTNSEYERAKERGQDYILALVYGLGEGERTEARLIIDPVNHLSLRPVAGIRLVGLAQATAVVLQFADVPETTDPVEALVVVKEEQFGS